MLKKALQYILGVLYLFAGIGKFFPQLESMQIVLKQSAKANKKTWLALPSNWGYRHHIFMTWFVAMSMITIGIVLLIIGFLAKEVLYASLFMIGFFMLFLSFSAPQKFIVDNPFVVVVIYPLKKICNQK